MDGRDSSELELLEVSRRVRKLTQIIDSWSKASKLDAQSKYVAKDLLRGSLNLQESLITIRRLQEASRMMSLMEQGFKKGREEDNRYEGYGSQSFRSALYDDIFQSLSANGSSWNDVNEIKSVINGKPLGKILESNFSNNIKVSSCRSFDPPTYSNLLITGNSKGMIDSTTRAKTSNLVAKIMGLEEIPSQVQSLKKEQKKGQCVNMFRKTLYGKNSKILYCFTEKASLPVRFSEGPQIVNLNSTHSSYESKAVLQKKKDILLLKVSQRNEVSEDCQMLSMKKDFMRMDRAAVESSQRFRSLAFVNHEKQIKKPVAVRVKQGSISNSKVLQERKCMKVTSDSLSQAKRARESLSKAKDNINAAKARVQAVCIQSAGSQKHITHTTGKFNAKSSSTSPLEGKKGEYLAKTCNTAKGVTTNRKGALQRSKPPKSNCPFPTACSSVPVHCNSQLQKDSKHCSRGDTRLRPMNFCEVMPTISNADKRSISIDSTMRSYEKEAAELEKGTKLMLLSSRMFLTTAEKLFGFDVPTHQAHSQSNRLDEFRIGNAYEVLLACAREFMFSKSYQLEIMAHPMWSTYKWRLKALKSMEELLENISNWISELNGYHKVSELEDGLYFMLERDLLCKDMPVSAPWDIGWLNWVCVEDFEAVLEVVEKQIIHGLVVEIAKDMVH